MLAHVLSANRRPVRYEMGEDVSGGPAGEVDVCRAGTGSRLVPARCGPTSMTSSFSSAAGAGTSEAACGDLGVGELAVTSSRTRLLLLGQVDAEHLA